MSNSKAADNLARILEVVFDDGTSRSDQLIKARNLIDESVGPVVELAKEESTRINEDNGDEYCCECCQNQKSIPKHFSNCKIGKLLAEWEK